MEDYAHRCECADTACGNHGEKAITLCRVPLKQTLAESRLCSVSARLASPGPSHSSVSIVSLGVKETSRPRSGF